MYLLAVCDSVKTGCGFMWGLSVVIILCATIACCVIKSEGGEIFPWVKILLAALVILLPFFIIGAALTPGKNDLIKAYCMTEGRKVLTAENTEKAVREFSEKLTEIINATGKGDGK